MRKLIASAPLAFGPLFVALGCSGGAAKAPPAASHKAPVAAVAPATPAAPLPPPDPVAVQRAVHALNRLGYGPRPGEAEAVARAGVDAWVAKQLAPASIDDRVFEAKLGGLAMPSLAMSMAELQEHYPRPKAAKKAAAQAALAASASTQSAGASTQSAGASAQSAGAGGATPGGAGGATKAASGAAGAGAGAGAAGAAGAMADEPKMKPAAIVQELSAQKLMRAVGSERQLQEVLVDFWFNHFNVFAEKDKIRWYVTSYERDVIRPRIFGRFRDLLGATARSPAMLVYLDNFRSVAEGSKGGGGKVRGLNENYARELLELHTLGVDGGYTQDDVREVARAFTGWTVERPEGDAAFVFRAKVHDREPKTVLGKMLYTGGEADGERVLDIVAAHPSTARFVAKKLARRFVADEPPAALVERLAEVFTKTDGQLAAVYAELFKSPEFWDETTRGAKTKTPFEFAASSLRALGAGYDGGPAFVRRVEQLGEPLYRCQPPTGFSDTADAWVNAGALINRLNFGLDAAGGRLPGVSFERGRLAGEGVASDAGELVDRLAASLLSAPASGRTRATVVEALERRGFDHAYEERAATHPLLPQAIGLLLGSPEFQKRLAMVNRRSFLHLSGAAGLSLLGTRLAFGQAKKPGAAGRPKALVVVLQRGALDGLSAVVPYAEPAYYDARPNIAIAAPGKGDEAALKLDNHFGLHPSLATLKPLFDGGKLAIVHAAGSPDLTRSHFDAQDYVESGTPGLKATADGWLNRALAARAQAGGASAPLRAVALQPGMPRILFGPVPAVAFASMGEFRVRGKAAESDATARSFAEMYDEAVDRSLRETAGGAFEASKRLQALRSGGEAPANGATYPTTALGRRLREVAQLLRADVGLEIAVTDCGGWDTHAGQGSAKGQLATRLRDFGDSLAAFATDLGDRMGDVCLVTATEFGRTVRENGTGGTDHGHGSVMFVLGGGVRGRKVYAKNWKGLDATHLHEGRDLPATTDHRDVFAEALRAQFKLSNLSAVFPGHEPKPERKLGLFG